MLTTHPTVRSVHAARFSARIRSLFPATPAAVVLLGFLMSGCMVPLHTRGQRSAEPPQVFGRKLVIDKEPPLVLIAEDGTRCQTTRDRFERTRVGSKVWCLWTGDGVRGLADRRLSYGTSMLRSRRMESKRNPPNTSADIMIATPRLRWLPIANRRSSSPCIRAIA